MYLHITLSTFIYILLHFNFASFNTSFSNPFSIDFIAKTVCAIGTPILRSTVESVRSRCNLETGSFADRCSNKAFAMPRFHSAFSKSIGFTLCGIAEEPISPFFVFCLK